MAKQEIEEAVRERLRIANERLSAKNGVNPDNPSYRQKVANIRYAMDHGIPYTEAVNHKKGKYIPPETNHPTVAEVERRIGRPINNKRPDSLTSTGKAVRDVLTGKVYQSLGQLAKARGMYWTTVRTYIEAKRLFPNNTYYEFI
jgi:hypothetical protein